LDDLSIMGPEFWEQVDRAKFDQTMALDEVYRLSRQRVEDEANPMLQDVRRQRAAAAPAGGITQVSTDPEGNIEADLTTAAGATEPAKPPVSTVETVSQALTSIGLRGIRPMAPAQSFVEALYGQDPTKEKNPVYITARRIAPLVDAALTAINVPVTGIGDLVNVLFAPLTLGLRAAGVREEDVQGFIENARLIPEVAASFEIGAQGLLGILGKIGNLTGASREVSGLVSQVTKNVARQAEHSVSLTREAARLGIDEPLLRTALTAATDGTVAGTTDLERLTYALMATGVPGTRAHTLAKQAQPLLKDAGLMEARSISGGAPAQLLPDDPGTIAQKFRDAVIEQRRGGPREQAMVIAEAKIAIKAGLVDLETVRLYAPGTTLNDGQTAQVALLLADSGLKTKALAQKALLTGDQADVTAALTQFYAHGSLDPKRIATGTEVARSEAIMGNPELAGLNQFLMQFEQVFHDATKGTTPQMILESIAKLSDPGQLAVVAKSAAKPGFWQMFNEYYVGGLLWGPRTWEVNALGGLVTTPWAVLERTAAGLVGRKGGASVDEAVGLAGGMYAATGDAWRLAWKAFVEDERQFAKTFAPDPYGPTGAAAQVTREELKYHRSISAENLEWSGALGQAADYFGSAIRFPFRILGAADDFFSVINYRGELKALSIRQARREATQQGLDGKAFDAYVGNRIPEIVADPPLSVKQAAMSFALEQTLQADLGPVGQWLSKGSQLPGGKLFLTFVKTPVNSLKYAARHSGVTPVAQAGFKQLGKAMGATMDKFRDDLNAPDVATRDRARGQIVLGGLTMGAISTLAWNGLVTGSAPRDPETMRNLRAIGWQANSFNVSALSRLATGRDHTPRAGDQYVGFDKLEPAATVFGIVADITNVVAAQPWTDIEQMSPAIQAAIIGSVASVAKQVSSRSWVQGMARMFAAISDPDRSFERAVGGVITGLIPFSGLVRQIEQVVAPELTESRSVMESVMSGIPGFSAKVPMYRDVFGRSFIPGGIYGPMAMQTLGEDDVAKALVEYDAKAPEIPDALSVLGTQKIALTPEERDTWAIERGRDVRKELAAQIAKFRPNESAMVRGFKLESILRKHHMQGLDRMMDQFPVVRESRDAANHAFAEKMRSGEPAPDALTPLIRSLGR